jgi:hypothetical protein
VRDELAFAPQRALAWTYARLVQNGIWQAEVGNTTIDAKQLPIGAAIGYRSPPVAMVNDAELDPATTPTALSSGPRPAPIRVAQTGPPVRPAKPVSPPTPKQTDSRPNHPTLTGPRTYS